MAAAYYWIPKWTGHFYNEKLGKLHFWLSTIFVNLTFFPMHFLGLLGMPRRISDYEAGLGWEFFNQMATVGSFLIAASILPTRTRAKPPGVNNTFRVRHTRIWTAIFRPP